ncbi:hypothetical protein DMB65_08280 [Flavobacterium cheongpyeongense]|uniref:Uncharacterized protein n=1 Tax=Flavobacterium cheongpyeongense TaxID=2212651 RepID=A0A2V4BQT1_9FLAO|nr:hypothetical protein [Flavobacterium cheongpyeongense]PXY41388.1 hypothetical protein DMB65_08280 [Flavobacterium cheongpyeongense]
MSKPTFEDFIELCKLNTENAYVPELLNITKDSDCIYSSGIIMPYEHVLDIYTIRLEIAEENKKLSENEILDSKSCVNNISKVKSENIGILNLATENNFYMLFYEPKENRIIGIIKFLKTESLNDVENYNDETIQKGFSSKAQKYSKGKLIKEWK